MKHHYKLIGRLNVITAALAASALAATPALATPSSGVTATTMSNGPFGALNVKGTNAEWHLDVKSNHGTTISTIRITIAPGGTSGWHSHPGINFLTMLSGAVVEYDGDNPLCTSKTIHAGETFVDDGDTAIHLVRNEGSVPAEFIAVAMYNAGATATRIDRPKPNNCPF